MPVTQTIPNSQTISLWIQVNTRGKHGITRDLPLNTRDLTLNTREVLSSCYKKASAMSM